MKGIFFALSALAATAFAAPSIPSTGAIDTGAVKADSVGLQREAANDLVSVLNSGFEDVKKTTSAIRTFLISLSTLTPYY